MAVAEAKNSKIGGGAPEYGVGPPLGAGVEKALNPVLKRRWRWWRLGFRRIDWNRVGGEEGRRWRGLWRGAR
ncbi:hypothetical protein IEQ34_014374 [Dendrobium chrysotoxum]|uniref:Uncharacterized protein n=1 Tax=Dendrobium chrysotoxum TaxID=161865 RepID=A0AAV7GLT3_DENCH|nr:hypothetical protein IEQ34_014374 [Dendrobium chrysotoxum]